MKYVSDENMELYTQLFQQWVEDYVANKGINYITTAPTADNTDGIKIVVLSSEPQTKYNGYLYLITA